MQLLKRSLSVSGHLISTRVVRQTHILHPHWNEENQSLDRH